MVRKEDPPRSSKILNWQLICKVLISNPSSLRAPESTGRHETSLSMSQTLETKIFEAELGGKNPTK